MLLYFFIYYLLGGLGVNLGFHRVLSHRGLRLNKWVERVCVFLGLPAGTPVQWVGNHRFHHQNTDTVNDPHSPIHHGFWYAHTGWYLKSHNVAACIAYALAGPGRMLFDAWYRPRTNQEYVHLSKDVSSDSVYAWMSKPGPYALLMHVHATAAIGIPVALWGWSGLLLAWATFVVLYNLGDSVDSVAHLYGSRLPNQRDGSRNGLVMGLLVLGEGWHANHHQFPRSARHGIFSGQFDLIWQIIRLLHACGLATDIYVPDNATIRNKLGETECQFQELHQS